MKRISILACVLGVCFVSAAWAQQPAPPNLACYSVKDLGNFDFVQYEILGLNQQGAVVGPTVRWGPRQGFYYNKGIFQRLYPLGGQIADARAINAWGQIVGTSQVSDGSYRATMWYQGVPFNLGALSGGGFSGANSVNDYGDVAGSSGVPYDANAHATAWFQGKPVNLGVNGEMMSYANGINNRRQVAMDSADANWTWHSFIWASGARKEIPLSTGNLFVNAINNAGATCGSGDFPKGFHPWVYDGKNVMDLDPTGQWWWGQCGGLNDLGQIVGEFGGQTGNHAFLWRNAKEGLLNLNSGTPLDFPTDLFDAFNINKSGQITAAGTVNGETHGFLLSPRQCGSQCVTPPENLIGWWPGEGSAFNVVSGYEDLEYAITYAPAVVRGGFSFDGYNSAIEVPDSPALHTLTHQVTFTAWINPQVPVGPDGGPPGETLGDMLAHRDPLITESIRFELRNDGALWTVLGTTNGGFWIGSWNPIKFDGNWKHLAMVVDTDAGRIAYYINGELLHEEYPTGLQGAQFLDASHNYIGQRQPNDTQEDPNYTNHYRGLMDEVQLFNRALTHAEIKAIYQASMKGVCRPLLPQPIGPQCVSPLAGLIGWWPGEGNTLDVMSGNQATGQGITYAPAVVNRGFVFDGTDSAIEVPDSPVLHSITNQVTVMAWVNPQSPVSGPTGSHLFSRRDPPWGEGVTLFITDAGYLAAALGTTNGSIWLAAEDLPLKFNGGWQHVAMTADTNTGTLSFFVNGRLAREEYHPDGLLGSQFADVSHLYIGESQPSDVQGAGQSYYYRGMMDEVQVFNRSLSQDEIVAIYLAGSKGVCRQCRQNAP